MMRFHIQQIMLRRNLYFIMNRNLLWQESCFLQTKPFTTAVKKDIEDITEKKKEVKNIWFYSNKGIRNRKIKQVLRNAYSEEETANQDVLHVRRLIEVFKTYGFSQKEIEKLIYSKAQLLQLSKTMLRKHIKSLRSVDLPMENVKSMIIAYPGLLLLDGEVSIQKRLNTLQELKLFPRLDQQRSLYLIQKCPQLIAFAKEKKDLQEKINTLESYGLHEQQIYQLVMKFPAIFTMNVNLLNEKLKYLTEKMNGRIGLVVKFPRYLTTSMRRIKERHAYLLAEHFMQEKSHLSERKLKTMILTSDSDFVYKITNTKMKDYREFQRTFDDSEYHKADDNRDINLDTSVVESDNSFSDAGNVNPTVTKDDFEVFLDEYENLKK